MFFTLYNLISIFILLPVLFYHLYRSLSRGREPAFAERFGYIPASALKLFEKRRIIWVHAVSVGEAIAARPLLKALRSRYPRHLLLLSTTTETGRGVAESFSETDASVYFPFDFLPAVRRSLNTIRPDLVIIMETEIWPNFSREAFKRNIPMILANGRISDRSFGRYLKFSWFFRQPLELFSQLCMQTDVDSERIIAIGAPPERTLTTGNLKYDIPVRKVSEEEKSDIRALYRISIGLKVFTAASTHPGEEELIIAAYRELAKEDDTLFLVLVPRHPERAATVSALLEKSGMNHYRRSSQDDGTAMMFRSGEVLLVDTIGELMNLYAISDLAFVGGSLVPTGGHNLLEPASVGAPFIFGPYMNNFREISGIVTERLAGIQLAGDSELIQTCRTLLGDKKLRGELGANGLRMIQDTGGATVKHIECISQYL